MSKSLIAGIFADVLCYVMMVSLAGAMGTAAYGQQKSQVADVKIDNFSFGPSELKVPVGTTVTWTNRDDIPHTVVSTDGAFKSKVLDTDEKFSFTFAKPGAYPYFCSIHPKMTGKIVVQ
jgi:plastocyanin